MGIERVERALAGYEPVLAAWRDGMNGAQMIDACRRVDDLPQALAAIDLALWDRAGKRAGKPVAALLTDDPATTVDVNATLTALDRAGVAQQAARAVSEGFTCVKVKVGVGDDAGRVAAARAAMGLQGALRLDANGAWNVEEAVRAIDALAPAGLELVEEPTHGLKDVREVRERVGTRVAIDETAAEHGALGAGVADAVCLKISRCGGISGLIAAATLVRASGAEAYVASTFDGPSASPRRFTPRRRWPRAGPFRTAAWRRWECSMGSRTRCLQSRGSPCRAALAWESAALVSRSKTRSGRGETRFESGCLSSRSPTATAAGFSSGRP